MEREFQGGIRDTVTGEVTLAINGVTITISEGGDVSIQTAGKISMKAQQIDLHTDHPGAGNRRRRGGEKMGWSSIWAGMFTVSDQRIFTPSNLKGRAGSDWANHEIVGKKARSQWVGPKLKSYTMDLLLRAQDGVSPGPRWTTSSGRRKADGRLVHHRRATDL